MKRVLWTLTAICAAVVLLALLASNQSIQAQEPEHELFLPHIVARGPNVCVVPGRCYTQTPTVTSTPMPTSTAILTETATVTPTQTLMVSPTASATPQPGFIIQSDRGTLITEGRDTNWDEFPGCGIGNDYQAWQRMRCLVGFPVRSLDYLVDKAEAIFQVRSCFECRPMTVKACPIVEPWDSSTVTWRTMPIYDPYMCATSTILPRSGMTTKGKEFWGKWGSQHKTNSHWTVVFDLTWIATGWIEGTIPANGLILVGDETTEPLDWDMIYLEGEEVPLLKIWGLPVQ